MRATELQVPNTTTPMCVAHTESGQRCVRPALPGQLVCGVHSKQRHYEVTRGLLAKCEEILGTAAQHARSEGGSTGERVQAETLKLKIQVSRLRSGLL